MRTSQQYLEKLRSMKMNLYMWGKKVDVPVDDPQIRTNYNAVAVTYDMAQDPQFEDLLTTVSPVSGQRVNRFNTVYRSTDDLMKRVDANRLMCHKTGTCIARCAGIDGLHAIGIASYEADRALGTEYHRNFLNYMRYFEEEDLVAAGAVTDVKGDRSLRPHEQVDPDLYLRVVEKRKDGIVVRGAKAHNSHAAVCDELIVVPVRALTAKDADYAVAFATPTDAPGITLINVAKSPRVQKKFENPISGKFAFSDSLTVFDNVFVPWERVFMCGEWQYAARLGGLFGHFHRHSHCGCIPARCDVLMGAASLVARYNGVRDKGHIRSKLVDLIISGEIVYACGIAASMKGAATPSGIYQPEITFCNAGKFHSGQTVTHDLEIMADIAGGLVWTMPSEEDYFLPQVGDYIKKFLKTRAEVDVEDRVRLYRLVEDLTVSRFATCFSVAEVIGAGPPEAQRIAILSAYDLDEKEELAKLLAGITSELPDRKRPVIAG